jgi:hypothetical protein
METRPEASGQSCQVAVVEARAPATGWIGWSPIAGLVAGIPSGWLLAYLASLPFMLGIFFFMVLGLITGAIMFRFGSKARLPATWLLWAIGSTVAAALMVTSVWSEYADALPRNLRKAVRDSYQESFSQARLADLNTSVRGHLASYLATQYPPGGFMGYLRWTVRNGVLTCPRFQKPGEVEYRLPYKRGRWLIRTGLSALLVEWAIMSQVLSLRKRRSPDLEVPAAGGEVGRKGYA